MSTPESHPLALVTGSAHRLGKSFALTLARLGYDIVLHYHSAEEEARQTQLEIESLSRRVYLIQADLTQPSEINNIFTQLEFILHPFDVAQDKPSSFILEVLVNSAAFMPSGKVDSLSLETWNTTLDLNLRARFCLLKPAPKK